MQVAVAHYSGKSSGYGKVNGGKKGAGVISRGGEITQWTGRVGRQMGRERGAAVKGRPEIVGAHKQQGHSLLLSHVQG